MAPPHAIGPVRPVFRTIVAAVAPAASSMDESGWTRAEAIVDDALSQRSASIRRQIVLFIRLLDLMALVRCGRRLRSLDGEQARGFLSTVEKSRILLFRRGLWGVRTLAYMGYYAQDAVQTAVGYSASSVGWEAVGGSAGAWPERKGAGTPEASTLTAADGASHA